MHGTVVETERLILRRWSPEDAEAYMALYSEPEVFRWLGDGTGRPPVDVGQVRNRLERSAASEDRLGLWATVERSGPNLVGNCGLLATEESGGIELVYHIGRPYWGRGYATEAARACLEYGYGTLALPRIVALVYPQNLASIRVLEKIGMRPAGVRLAHGTSLRFYEST
jgi:[ribosomal protein S5]-alanine N-acetyltransferase